MAHFNDSIYETDSPNGCFVNDSTIVEASGVEPAPKPEANLKCKEKTNTKGKAKGKPKAKGKAKKAMKAMKACPKFAEEEEEEEEKEEDKASELLAEDNFRMHIGGGHNSDMVIFVMQGSKRSQVLIVSPSMVDGADVTPRMVCERVKEKVMDEDL